ncbi:hypothetical protein FNO01nite_15540 [Flavobacterium noncentrifugens]|uniref:Helix-turn-helix domain-containing protein n=1 Tax=Flavobacterium noncentrifugens TaxID=1128970 RepID=A0A1G8WDQ6_9FLAO|nr:helix-turn-helix transcriptional regulator [Flavobacterium noncentrifugens]GEP50882.1 hypothetical protein FNO01nite_15540 [Flavobacterium noncentrifugens]SDJ76394.1 Helix-turn-helix domain-containing protein [Flavobacterium noncentrifugens]
MKMLKQAREKKGFTTRQVSEMLKIDQALISKFENGLRRPTEKQLLGLADLLEIDFETLATEWLKGKIIELANSHKFGLKAFKVAEKELFAQAKSESPSDKFQKLFDEMESLRSILVQKDKE